MRIQKIEKYLCGLNWGFMAINVAHMSPLLVRMGQSARGVKRSGQNLQGRMARVNTSAMSCVPKRRQGGSTNVYFIIRLKE
jgi:hypothetical protein